MAARRVLRVLCVCFGNTCRSPMFAAVLERYLVAHGRTEVIVESAGRLESAKGQPAASEWVTLQGETGVDLGSHRSRWIGDLDPFEFNVIYCMDSETFDEVSKLHLAGVDVIIVNPPDGIPNPWQKGLDAYRECYETVTKIVARVASHL